MLCAIERGYPISIWFAVIVSAKKTDAEDANFSSDSVV
jgi:hypothetical protein